MPKSKHTKKSSQPTLIDLFAGCGGLSLGLEQAGFRPIFVSELNPHAMQTYLTNRAHLGLREGIDTCNDIASLTGKGKKQALKELATRLRTKWGDVTLVAGGPPCQGYSTRGIRSTFRSVERHETPSNHLYKDMARFIAAIAPQMFLFENVAGLRTARWSRTGERGEILEDIEDTFNSIRTWDDKKRYRIEPITIRCKDYGVPQNRPRLFLIGIREDVQIDLACSRAANGLFPDPSGNTPPDPIDLLGDLISPNDERRGISLVYPKEALSPIQKDLRRARDSRRISKKGAPLSDQEYTRHSDNVEERFRELIANPDGIEPSMTIKKFSQRALPRRWAEQGPTITATSAPDDYVHYCRPRILTVREWARLQTFPDWYKFAGPRTTGGRRRAGDPSQGIWERELPKYTQIGNAVPVLLAKQIGEHFRVILRLK